MAQAPIPVLWTQHGEVRWRPSIAFFEQRYAVLRTLDQDGLLRTFRHQDTRIDVRIGDADHLLSFGATGMAWSALKPNADVERLNAAAAGVWELMAPTELQNVRARALLQWIAPSRAATYDGARSAAATNTFGTPTVGEYLDYATIIEGRIEQPEADYHLEAGVASAVEIPQRLNRAMVRLRGPGEGGNIDAPPSMWPVDSLPKFALFCDSTWTLRHDLKASSWGTVADIFASVSSAALQTVDGIFGRLDEQERQDA